MNMEFVGKSLEKLNLLSDKNNAFIGRKGSMQKQYGEEGAMLLGKSAEENNLGQKVYLDALLPHVVFITGSRGSGKSYALGVIAEELILKNPNVSAVIIDPVGIFWSMKYPNKEEKELNALNEWNLEPMGIENTSVFIPYGLSKKIPKETYDRLFSLRPSELNVEDWCLTFGIERFSQSGLLLERAVEKAKEKHKNYSIEELIKIIETDKELTSKDRGYKSESRRALVSRLEAARSWGVFSKEGTSLAEICKKGIVSVIDISFLEENVSSLVIGMLSRKILNARKMITRQESMKGYVEEMQDIDELLNIEIPPTWLFIDEAHTLIPSGTAKTAATDGLIEYVKQGRRPGCSLVFATQQPSAIDTKVLSQLDLLLCHKLVFDEDLKAVMKRMPTSVPKEYDNSKFIKILPIGIALTGDRSDETSRAFCIKIRPRFSQHEGRDLKVGEESEKLSPEKVKELIMKMIAKKLQDSGKISLLKAEETIDTIKRRYDVKISNADIIKSIQKELECKIEEDYLLVPGFEEQKEIEMEVGDVKALTATMNKNEIEKIAEKNRKKKMLGFIGTDEKINEIKMVYEPAYKVNFNMKSGNSFIPKSIIISTDYEIYFNHNGIKKTENVKELLELNDKKIKVLRAVKKHRDIDGIAKQSGLTQQAAGQYLSELAKKGLVDKREIEKKKSEYLTVNKMEIPDLNDKKFNSSQISGDGKPQSGIEVEKTSIDEKLVEKIPKLFCECEITNIEKILVPVWKVTYSSADNERIQKFDAV